MSPPVAIPPVPQAKLRLPKLTLSKFKGDIKNWTAFWDSFQLAVHSNDVIPKVDKFNYYLNSLLEGPTYKTIQGLFLTDDSAVALLKECFGNSPLIINSHMTALINAPSCSSEHSSFLRALYDKIMVHLQGLEALHVTPEQYGATLTPVIMNKLPSDLQLRIARERGRAVWGIDQILKVVKLEVEAREASKGVAASMTNATPRPVKGSTPSTASALVASSRKIQCVYCEGDHFSASCQKVTESKDRKDILLKAGRCFNCLKMCHRFKDCDSPKNCRHCNRRHHQSICDQRSVTQKSSEDTVKPIEPASTTTSAASKPSKGNKTILLQTVRAVAVGKTGRVPIRILLDSSGQLLYITKTLQERLGIKPIQREKLHVNTFGNTSFDTRSCDVVRLQIQPTNGGETIELVAYSSPVICSSLPTLVSAQNYEHLEALELANGDYHDSKSIDVLVGSDYYWSIVTGDTLIGDCGPVALSSKLGWLLSGPLNSGDSIPFTQAHLDNPPSNSRDDVLAAEL